LQLKNNKGLNEAEHQVLERWLDEAKFTRVLKSSTTNEAVQRIICHYIFDSRMVQLQAIAVSKQEASLTVAVEKLNLLAVCCSFCHTTTTEYSLQTTVVTNILPAVIRRTPSVNIRNANAPFVCRH
jgi:hypothetical protein